MLIHDHISHGTLIVSVGTTSGWVVCADKRVSGNKPGYLSDQDRKITVVDGLSALVSSNNTKIVGPSGEVVFDADAVAVDFLRGKDSREISKLLPRLGTALERAFLSYLASRPPAVWPTASSSIPFVSVAIFTVDGGGKRRAAAAELLFESAAPVAVHARLADWSGTCVNVMGDIYLLQELSGGCDARFDDLRVHPALSTVLSRPFSDETPPESALDFGRALIYYTATRGSLLPGSTGSVSPGCDCVLVERGRTVWLVP